MTKFTKHRPTYSLEFKRQVITPVVLGKMSGHAARKAFGIKGKMTVYEWLDRRQEILGPNFDADTLTMSKPKQNEEDLRAQNEVLRKLLEQERLRSEAFLIMIKIAEEKHSISIEKKFGTKQS